MSPIAQVQSRVRSTYRLDSLLGKHQGPEVFYAENDVLAVSTLFPVHTDKHGGLTQRIWKLPPIPYKDSHSNAVANYETGMWEANRKHNKLHQNKPRQLTCIGRDSLLKWYEDHPSTLKDHSIPTKNDYRFFHHYAVDTPPSSSIPWKELKYVNLGDMMCHKRHFGQGLLCRIITKAKVGLGITFVVEDVEGRAIPLWIDIPFAKPAFLHEPSLIAQLYPIGATLIVREPLVQFSIISGVPEVCVGAPSDVVELPDVLMNSSWVYPSPRILPQYTVSEYKDLGNTAFKREEYLLAIRYYTLGLLLVTKYPDPNTELALLLNRAQAYLDNHMPGSAFRDCIKIDNLLDTATSSNKAYHLSEGQKPKLAWRKLKSAYYLRLYKHAQSLVEECKELGVTDADKYEQWIIQREKEKKEGKYDLVKLHNNYRRDDDRGVDIADYIGPIKIQDFGPGKGRGLVLTRNVKAGEVLWVEKALSNDSLTNCMSYDSLDAGPTNHDTMQTISHCHGVHKALDDWSDWLGWENLYPGDTANMPDQLITEFQRMNALQQDNPPSIDAGAMTKKRNANAFQGQDHPELHRMQFKMDIFGRIRFHTQVYSVMSLCNHSCVPNVASGAIGDMMVATAQHDMSAGTELHKPYCETGMSYKKRTLALMPWGFKCQCQLCEWDRADAHEARERMMDDEWPKLHRQLKRSEKAHFASIDIENMFKPGNKTNMDTPESKAAFQSVKDVEDFLVRLEKTYGKDRTVKMELAMVEQELASSAVAISRAVFLRKLAIEHTGVILNSLEEQQKSGIMIRSLPCLCGVGKVDLQEMVHDAYLAWLVLFRSNMPMIGYDQKRMKAEAKAWKRTGEWVWMMCNPVGGGMKEYHRKYDEKLIDHGLGFKMCNTEEEAQAHLKEWRETKNHSV